MQIKAVEFYILEGEPVVRQVSSRGRGTIDRVPGNLSGLNTHSAGFRSTKGDAVVSYVDDHPSPTYRAVLRLVTDGDLHPYADYATGFYAGDLEWKAKEFMAIIAPMLVGVDPFDR
ncbi:MAG: hypothetical protein GX552_19330, partial [Chloroflexi bacterium]|nr:hypothetical protein [Chloroflexota bacterium]